MEMLVLSSLISNLWVEGHRKREEHSSHFSQKTVSLKLWALIVRNWFGKKC